MHHLYLLLVSSLICLPGFAQAKATDDFRIERGVHRPGSDYDHFSTKNVNHCAKECKNSRRCRAFDFNKRDRTCRLKDRVPSTRRNNDVVSGVKRGSGGNGGHGGGNWNGGGSGGSVGGIRIRRETQLEGSDYSNFSANNPKQCARRCADQDRCRAFDFNLRTRKCYLKDGVPSSRRDRNHVSGVKKRSGGGHGNHGGSGGENWNFSNSGGRGDDADVDVYGNPN